MLKVVYILKTNSSITVTDKKDDSGKTTALIVGIVVGVGGFVIILIVVIVICLSREKAKKLVDLHVSLAFHHNQNVLYG